MGDRTLTDADVRAIAEAVAKNGHTCQFTEEEIVLVRRWLKKIDRLATAIGYAVLGGVVAAVLGALWAGIKSKLQTGG